MTRTRTCTYPRGQGRPFTMSASPTHCSSMSDAERRAWSTQQLTAARSAAVISSPDFRCLCCKRRSSRASARTRYLQRCLRRTGTDVTHLTCAYPLLAAALDVSRLIRTVRRRHVTAAESLVNGTFSIGTSDNGRSGRASDKSDDRQCCAGTVILVKSSGSGIRSICQGGELEPRGDTDEVCEQRCASPTRSRLGLWPVAVTGRVAWRGNSGRWLMRRGRCGGRVRGRGPALPVSRRRRWPPP